MLYIIFRKSGGRLKGERNRGWRESWEVGNGRGRLEGINSLCGLTILDSNYFHANG